MFDITKLKKNFVPTPIIKIALQLHSFKLMSSVPNFWQEKLGTQIRNITSIPSGEGEQLPMIFYLKHGLP
jgi:hypothetical protein